MKILFKILCIIGIVSTVVQLMKGNFFGFGILMAAGFGYLGWRDSNTSSKNSIPSSPLELLSYRYPNFANFIMTSKVSNLQIVRDKAEFLEYKFPLLTFGNVMGYIHIGIEKRQVSDVLYGYAQSNSNKIKGLEKNLTNDLTIEDYEAVLQNLNMVLMSNPAFRSMTIGN
jgi:hypothetical protein